mmetsp:Transcript_3284/g.10881  ORF Transcript_3284/g.10881 Transcript_3284/m.10881 type:complete len:117 (-) Transcript_3284:250-600(-)
MAPMTRCFYVAISTSLGGPQADYAKLAQARMDLLVNWLKHPTLVYTSGGVDEVRDIEMESSLLQGTQLTIEACVNVYGAPRSMLSQTALKRLVENSGAFPVPTTVVRRVVVRPETT